MTPPSSLRRARRPLALLLTATATTGLSACGDGPVAKSSATSGTTLKSCGMDMTFPKNPHRAVTMDQAATQTLLSLGAEKQMAGTSNIKTKVRPEHRDAYAKIKVLNPKIVTGEQLREAAPDVVVSTYSSFFIRDKAGDRAELAKAGIPTYISPVDCPKNYPGQGAFARQELEYTELGRIFGHEAAAKQLIETQRAAVAKAAEVKKTLTKPVRAVFVYSAYDGQPYVAGKEGIPQAVAEATGTTNIFADVDEVWPEVQWEQVGARTPDVIVVADLSERGRPGDKASEKIAEFKKNPATKNLDAVKKDRFIVVDGDGTDASPNSADFATQYVDGLKKLGLAR